MMDRRIESWEAKESSTIFLMKRPPLSFQMRLGAAGDLLHKVQHPIDLYVLRF